MMGALPPSLDREDCPFQEALYHRVVSARLRKAS